MFNTFIAYRRDHLGDPLFVETDILSLLAHYFTQAIVARNDDEDTPPSLLDA